MKRLVYFLLIFIMLFTKCFNTKDKADEKNSEIVEKINTASKNDIDYSSFTYYFPDSQYGFPVAITV